jgi:hypothetical protein
MDNRYLI